MEHTLAPYVTCVRLQMNLSMIQPALSIINILGVHRVKILCCLMDGNPIHMIYFPTNCAGELQSLELSDNAEFKDALKQKFT